MAEKIVAILLLLALFVGGAIMAFNLVEMMGFDLGMGFDSINGFMSGFWIIMARLVGIALMVLSVYVIIGIIRD